MWIANEQMKCIAVVVKHYFMSIQLITCNTKREYLFRLNPQHFWWDIWILHIDWPCFVFVSFICSVVSCINIQTLIQNRPMQVYFIRKSCCYCGIRFFLHVQRPIQKGKENWELCSVFCGGKMCDISEIEFKWVPRFLRKQ